jgi:hypothetical protein
MALDTKLAAATANAAANAAVALANGGKLRIYDGTKPTTADTAVSTQTKLAEFTLPSPAFGSASGGVATANAITASTVTASGTPAWFRVVDSSGNPAWDGTAGTSGTDLVLNASPLASPADISVTSWTYTQPEHA